MRTLNLLAARRVGSRFAANLGGSFLTKERSSARNYMPVQPRVKLGIWGFWRSFQDRAAVLAVAVVVVLMMTPSITYAQEQHRQRLNTEWNAITQEVEKLGAEATQAARDLEATSKLSIDEKSQKVDALVDQTHKLRDRLQDDAEVFQALRNFRRWSEGARAAVENDASLRPSDREELLKKWDEHLKSLMDAETSLFDMRQNLEATANVVRQERRRIAHEMMLAEAQKGLAQLKQLVDRIRQITEAIRTKLKDRTPVPVS